MPASRAESPSPALPPAYVDFLERFAGGRFWEAHEVLEGAWRDGRSGFYKGLILLASAWVHVGRGNARGVAAQLRKAERELAPYAPAYLGQDVDRLIALARAGAARASSLEGASPRDWADALPPPDLTPRPDLFRGDEPELTAG